MRRNVSVMALATTILASGAISYSTNQASSVQDDLLAVGATRLTLIAETQTLEIDLVNHTNREAIAYGVALTFTADGAAQRVGFLRDAVPGRGVPPHGTLSVTQPIMPPGVRVENVQARLKFAIFDDDTWIGEESEVTRLFGIRVGELSSWTIIRDALQAGLGASGRLGLETALALLSRNEQEDRDNLMKKGIRRNLQMAIEAIERDPFRTTADAYLRPLHAQAQTHVNFLTSHLVMKERRGVK